LAVSVRLRHPFSNASDFALSLGLLEAILECDLGDEVVDYHSNDANHVRSKRKNTSDGRKIILVASYFAATLRIVRIAP
jgi:hypothetical protein